MEKIHVSQCYCHIPHETLVDLVRKKFIGGIPTTTLMSQMKSEKEREYVATVALLDVKREDLIKAVQMDNPEELKHLLVCHVEAKKILAQNGLDIGSQ